MAKAKKMKSDIFSGLGSLTNSVGKMVGSVGLSAKSTHRYKATPQVKGRIARAFARETRGGKGKDSLRAGYKFHMKKGYKQTTVQQRAKVVQALAKNTVKGKGRIAKRHAYKKFVKY